MLCLPSEGQEPSEEAWEGEKQRKKDQEERKITDWAEANLYSSEKDEGLKQ